MLRTETLDADFAALTDANLTALEPFRRYGGSMQNRTNHPRCRPGVEVAIDAATGHMLHSVYTQDFRVYAGNAPLPDPGGSDGGRRLIRAVTAGTARRGR